MANRRIEDFGILADAQDDDLLLVASGHATYALKFSTLSTFIKAALDKEALNINPADLGLEKDENSGLIYPTYKGKRSPTGVAAGGGGAFSQVLVDLMESKDFTVVRGEPTELRYIYYCTDTEGILDRPGVGKILEDGVERYVFEVPHGEGSIDIAPYLTTLGERIVKFTVENSEGTPRALTFTVDYISLDMVRIVERTLAGDYVNDSANGIGDYTFYNLDQLTSARFDKAKSVGQYAFYDCDKLLRADLPLAESIGAYAFSSCDLLTEVVAPQVTSIGTYAFQNCKALTNCALPLLTAVPAGSFYAAKITKADFSVVSSIAANAFYNCSSLTALVLRNTKAICTLANKNALTNSAIANGTGYIYVPRTMDDGSDGPTVYAMATNWTNYSARFRAIEDYPRDHRRLIEMSDFKNTVDILGDQEVTDRLIARTITEFADDRVTVFTENSFKGCNALAVLKLPKVLTVPDSAFTGLPALAHAAFDAATSIGRYSFNGCVALQTVSAPKAKSIGWTAFNSCEALTQADFPEATSVPQYAFGGCFALRVLNMPKVTAIGETAFANCKSLEGVDLPALISLGKGAFSGCTILAFLNAPKVTGIGEYAFQNCLALTEVDFPLATTLGTYAYDGCAAVVSVNLPLVTVISDYAFQNCTSLCTASVPEVTSVGKNAFAYTALPAISLPLATTIGASAFYMCPDLVSVDLPAATSFAAWAFSNCGKLTAVNAPLVTKALVAALQGCSSLESVDFPLLTTAGQSVFEGCTSLKSVNLPALKSVDRSCFGGCTSLERLTLPAATYLAGWAFNGCTALGVLDCHSLTSIDWQYPLNNTNIHTLILRNTAQVCSLGGTGALGNLIEAGTGYIYVPRTMADGSDGPTAYASATNWSKYAGQFRAIEDYSVDGTLNGEIAPDGGIERESFEYSVSDMSAVLETKPGYYDPSGRFVSDSSYVSWKVPCGAGDSFVQYSTSGYGMYKTYWDETGNFLDSNTPADKSPTAFTVPNNPAIAYMWTAIRKSDIDNGSYKLVRSVAVS